MEAGAFGFRLGFPEAEDDGLRVRRDGVKTGGDSDEHDHGKDTEPDE